MEGQRLTIGTTKDELLPAGTPTAASEGYP